VSRVTWLVLGTTMVLVSAVVVAAVVFINGSSQRFPSGAGPGASGVARVASAGAHRSNHRPGARGLRPPASSGARQVAAHPAATGLAASLGPGPRGPPPGPGLSSPTGHQYGDSLQQLKAALGQR
jgi:hypothetical protein